MKMALLITLLLLVAVVGVVLASTVSQFSDESGSANFTFTSAGLQSKMVRLHNSSRVDKFTIDLKGYGDVKGFFSNNISAPQDIKVRSVTTNGTHMWLVNNSNAKVYETTMDGTLTGKNFSVFTGVSGIDYDTDNGMIWTVSSTNIVNKNNVRRYYINGTLERQWYTVSGHSDSRDLTVGESSFLYITDVGTDKLNKYSQDGTFQSISVEMHTNNTDLAGIEYNGSHYFVMDSIDSMIYVYKLNVNTFDFVRKIDVDNTVAGITFPSAMAQNGSFFWTTEGSGDGRTTISKFYLGEQQYPTNVSVYVGSPLVFENLSVFNGVLDDVDLNATALEQCLNSTATSDSNGFANCTLNFGSESAGVLEVSDLNIDYFASPWSILQNGLELFNQTSVRSANLSFSLVVSHDFPESINQVATYNFSSSVDGNFSVGFTPVEVVVSEESTNSTLVSINISPTASFSNHSFNLTVHQLNTSRDYQFPVYLTVNSQSAVLSLDNVSVWQSSVDSATSFSRVFEVNNTGSYNGSSCDWRALNADDSINSVLQAGISYVTFSVSNGTKKNSTVNFLISTSGTYTSEVLDLFCDGSPGGEGVRLVNNVPLNFSITQFVSSTGGGGGTQSVVDVDLSGELLNLTCGDGKCQSNEDERVCAKDCLTLEAQLSSRFLPRTIFVFLGVVFFGSLFFGKKQKNGGW